MRAILFIFATLCFCNACAMQNAAPNSSVAAPSPSEISMADRLQILDLLSRYSHTYDNRNTTAFAALFEDDAILQLYNADGLITEMKTNSERIDRIGDRHQMQIDKGIQPRHFQTNTLLTANADGSVSGETLFFITRQYPDEETPRLIHTGVYRDIYVQSQSAWKFARREVWIDHK